MNFQQIPSFIADATSVASRFNVVWWTNGHGNFGILHFQLEQTMGVSIKNFAFDVSGHSARMYVNSRHKIEENVIAVGLLKKRKKENCVTLVVEVIFIVDLTHFRLWMCKCNF